MLASDHLFGLTGGLVTALCGSLLDSSASIGGFSILLFLLGAFVVELYGHRYLKTFDSYKTDQFLGAMFYGTLVGVLLWPFLTFLVTRVFGITSEASSITVSLIRLPEFITKIPGSAYSTPPNFRLYFGMWLCVTAVGYLGGLTGGAVVMLTRSEVKLSTQFLVYFRGILIIIVATLVLVRFGYPWYAGIVLGIST